MLWNSRRVQQSAWHSTGAMVGTRRASLRAHRHRFDTARAWQKTYRPAASAVGGVNRQPSPSHYSDPSYRGTAFAKQRVLGLLTGVSGFLRIAEMRFHDFRIPLHCQNDCLLFQPRR